GAKASRFVGGRENVEDSGNRRGIARGPCPRPPILDQQYGEPTRRHVAGRGTGERRQGFDARRRAGADSFRSTTPWRRASPLSDREVLRVYVSHYTEQRPHRGLDLATPRGGASSPARHTERRRIHRRDVLGGLIHEYEWAA